MRSLGLLLTASVTVAISQTICANADPDISTELRRYVARLAGVQNGSVNGSFHLDRIYLWSAPSGEGKSYEVWYRLPASGLAQHPVGSRFLVRECREISALRGTSRWISTAVRRLGERDYWNKIASRDQASKMAIVYLDSSGSARPSSSDSTTTISRAAEVTVLERLLEDAPVKTAASDPDVKACWDLILKGLHPDAANRDGEDALRDRANMFRNAHYYLARVELRHAVLLRAGKVKEKNQRHFEAVRQWALNTDTGSMPGPKPTMDNLLILEPDNEKLARRLADAYASQIRDIKAKLQELFGQLCVASEKLWRPKDREKRLIAILGEAQEYEDRGRTSFGGEARVDGLSRDFGRVISPILVDIRGTTPADSLCEASAKLLSAVSSSLAMAVESRAQSTERPPPTRHSDSTASPKRSEAVANAKAPFQAELVPKLAKPEVVIINNSSGNTITLRLDGPDRHSVTLSPAKQGRITIEPGTYKYEATSQGVLPASGVYEFETQHRYTWRFYVREIRR